MKTFISTAFYLCFLLCKSVYATCSFNNSNYERNIENKYMLQVHRDKNNLNKSNNYSCYISYSNGDPGYLHNIYKCSDNITISETKFVSNFKHYTQETWVLIDKNENTFVLEPTEKPINQIYELVPYDCSTIVNKKTSEFEFSENVNYSKKALFILQEYQYYKLKDRPSPVF